jgi:hemolysin activation/secretion protein
MRVVKCQIEISLAAARLWINEGYGMTGNFRGVGITKVAFVLASLAALSAGPAAAQTVPPSAEPGRVPQRFEPPRTPGVDTQITVPQIPTAVPPEQARQIRFMLRGVTVNGSSVYSAQQLAPLYQSLVGREVSLLEVYGIANQITARYRNDGFVLSQAIVPQQQIRDGVVQILIVEGRINRVIIKDEGKLRSYNYLLQYAERLRASQPITQRELERYLLLLNDLPGMRVSGVLAPSDVPGTSDLILEVTYKRIDAYASIDNRGSRFLGPYQAEVSGAYNGLIDTGDRLLYRYVVSLFQPRELQFHEARFQTPILGYGTIMEVWGNYARTRPGHTLRILDIEGESWSWNIKLKQPLLRTRAMNFWVYGQFNWQNSTNDVLTATFSDDRLRVFRYGTTFEAVDEFRGITFVDLQVSHGIDGLGARGNSREFGRTNFTKVNLDVQRNQQIWGPVSAFVQFTGQYAATQLLAQEEFGLGGRTYGRAFDPSEKTGDHGMAVAAELRYTVEDLKFPMLDLPTTLQFYGFGDWGRVYHIDSNTRKSFEQLASAGVGMRFTVGPRVSGQVEGAVPLYGRTAALGDMGDTWRVFFILNARY